jgi:PAS domain S-box-containing protein
VIDPAELLRARILVVDDLPANLVVMDEMLRIAGYTDICCTRDSTTVCALHRAQPFDLILLDLLMPGIDGFAVLADLKAIDPDGWLPVIVITARSDHKVRALASGARDFIGKPFDLPEVCLRVHNLLEVRLLQRNEAALSLSRLENSQRTGVIGDWDCDFGTDRLHWSDEVYRILGLTREAFPPSADTFYSRVHPDDRERIRLLKSKAKGSRFAFEHRIVRPDGAVRIIHQIVEIGLNAAGKAVRELGTFQDVTDQRLAESVLRESEARYRMMFERNPSAMWVFDRNTYRILAVNEVACSLFGYTPAEFLALKVDQIRSAGLNPDYLETVSPFQPAFKGVGNHRYRRKDGTTLPIDIFAHDIEFEGHQGKLVLGVDRTEAQTAAEALRSSEERFKLVAKAVSDVVWDWDLVAGTFWRSEGFPGESNFGAWVAGPTLESWLDQVHPDDRERVGSSLKLALESGAAHWSQEYRLKLGNGLESHVRDNGYILRDATGQAFRVVGGMRDMTEQKALEEQILRNQRMDSIGALAGGIAHDLNNVLAPIMMGVDLLKGDKNNDPRRAKILETIHISTRRGAELVRQVLSFARGADGTRAAVPVLPLIHDLEMITTETFDRNIRTQVEVPDGIWALKGDATQVHQVLLNLAVNARDAMPGGGLLSIRASNLEVDAAYALRSPEAKVGRYVLLEVADTGHGMAPEVRARIFEPFFTTKEPGKGTGIGLATVHGIIKSHGGFLEVESEFGRGTTFRVFFPAMPDSKTANSAPPIPAMERGQNELILVIDDESSIRDITQHTLEAFGYRVVTAGNGAEGVAIFAKHAKAFTLVITDMMMPVMDGLATIQVLRRIEPTLRIIAVTGVATVNEEALNKLEVVQLLKPFTAEALLRKCRKAILSPGPGSLDPARHSREALVS